MSRKHKSIYLAGPMTGLDEFNYPAFREVAVGLESMGWAVHNPANSFNGSTRLPYHLYMTSALNLLMIADAIALMDGWQESRGARLEALIAQRFELPFFNAHTGRLMRVDELDVESPNVLSEGGRPWPKNEMLLKRLIPLAQELAQGNSDGVTVSDIREAALERGILSGEEHPNQLSVLGHVCRRAGLIHFGTTRRSNLAVTHGIRQTVWFENLAA